MAVELTTEQAQAVFDLVLSLLDALDINDVEHTEPLKKLLNIEE